MVLGSFQVEDSACLFSEMMRHRDAHLHGLCSIFCVYHASFKAGGWSMFFFCPFPFPDRHSARPTVPLRAVLSAGGG